MPASGDRRAVKLRLTLPMTQVYSASHLRSVAQSGPEKKKRGPGLGELESSGWQMRDEGSMRYAVDRVRSEKTRGALKQSENDGNSRE